MMPMMTSKIILSIGMIIDPKVYEKCHKNRTIFMRLSL